MITIDPDGKVTATLENSFLTWSEVFEPGDDERAQALLSADEIKTIQAAWTLEIVAEYKAKAKNEQPLPQNFAGQQVRSADDVDRVTAARVSALVAPGLVGDVAQLRQLSILRTSISLTRKAASGQASEAELTQLAQLELLDVQVDALIAEGDAFKQAQGW